MGGGEVLGVSAELVVEGGGRVMLNALDRPWMGGVRSKAEVGEIPAAA